MTPGFFLMLVLSALLGALEVLPAVLLAALGHEGGHLLALRLFRVPVKAIRLSAMGAVIEAPGQERLSYGRELLAVLAGANAILGVYNLLPLRGLDGGRALYLALAWALGPFRAASAAGVVNAAALALLLGAAALLLWETGGGLFCLSAALGTLLAQLRPLRRRRRGNRGCQTAKKRIQYIR